MLLSSRGLRCLQAHELDHVAVDQEIHQHEMDPDTRLEWVQPQEIGKPTIREDCGLGGTAPSETSQGQQHCGAAEELHTSNAKFHRDAGV